MEDSLKIIQNEDKSYTAEWDREDPQWAFLNNLTSREIQVIIQEAIKDYEND